MAQDEDEDEEISLLRLIASWLWALLIAPMVLFGATAALYSVVDYFLLSEKLVATLSMVPRPIAIFSAFINMFSAAISVSVARQLSLPSNGKGIRFGSLIWCVALIALGAYASWQEFGLNAVSDVFLGYCCVPLVGILSLLKGFLKMRKQKREEDDDDEE